MADGDKVEGVLVFDEYTAKFWIIKDDVGLKSLDFGDKFEVKVDDIWVDTCIEIGSNDDGELIFKLKNTPYQGNMDGVSARA